MNTPKPPHFLSSTAGSFRYVEKTNPHRSNLEFLTYGVYELRGKLESGLLAHPGEEALLFCWQGQATARISGRDYPLDHYDVLYVPRDTPYRLSQGEGEGKIIVCRAVAEKTHPIFHAPWKEFSRDEKRIRHLKGKDVFLMFDVSEAAD